SSQRKYYCVSEHGSINPAAAWRASPLRLAGPCCKAPCRIARFTASGRPVCRCQCMPELPEVETTRRGIAPHVEGRRVAAVTVRQAALRWPIPVQLGEQLPGEVITAVTRRAKYLLFHTGSGCMLVHLGMSGSLRLVASSEPVRKHDHVD